LYVRVSGYTNQAAIQIEIIASLAKLLRGGKYTSTVGIPESLILVGHSFGTYITNAVLAKYPFLADAAILTGTSYSVPAYGPKLLLEASAARIASTVSHEFEELDTGYVFFADINAHVNIFFKKPAYEVEAVQYAQSIAQPFAISEYLTMGLMSLLSPGFKGPVFVTTGEFDFGACAGECYSSYREQSLKAVFPNSRLIDSYVHPGAGHGINLATNATGFYNVIANFLERAGF
jgi:pimeloyl-ACP methyl ester carboxylesterase